jgi:hypothetical protein
MTYNKSAIFVSQMFEFDKAPVKVFDDKVFVNSYLVDPVLDGGTYQGSLYMVFRAGLPQPLTDFLVSHPAFQTMYCTTTGLAVFSFAHGEYVEGTVKPFLRGAYSKMERVYVERYFPNVQTHPRYGSRKVMDRHPDYKAWQEERIGVTLPDDAEVWCKVKMTDETFYPELVDPLPTV